MMKNGEKTKKGKHGGKIFGRCFLVLAALLLLCVLLGVGAFAWTAAHTDTEADMEVMEMMRGSRTTRLYAPDGSTPREDLTLDNYLPKEVDILFGDENMIWAQSEEIPETLKHAFVAIEDQRFYTHRGVDWRRTALAALNCVFRFRDRFGGSTITQQLIKNVHGDKDISAVRKMKEIIRALRLEKEYSKDEILTYYLNIVPLGHGCVGVKSAARYYFNKRPDELTDGECAALAAITNAPARYEPVSHAENNAARRELVLSAMQENGYLSGEEYLRASGSELVLNVTDPVYTGNHHNWYTETVITDVVRDLMASLDISEGAATTMLYRGGLEIYTLMDTEVQNTLDGYFGDASRFTDENGRRIEAGMVITDPRSGDVLGIIGGVGEKQGARLFNRAVGGYYQPGSTLKPLALYGPGIEWDAIHYASAFEDAPAETAEGFWPHNSPNLYAGRITAHEALAKSKNTVAVQLLELLGREKVYRHLEETIGLTGLVRGGSVSDLSPAPLALGQLSHGVTVRELTAAYGSFASGGSLIQPRTYLAVYDSKGAPLLKAERQEKRVWSEETAYLLTRMMCEVVDNGTARRITLKEVVDTAGKTGTSGANRDKWFVGYTPYYVAGLHCGYDDGTPLEAAGKLHLEAWDAVMQSLHRRVLTSEGSIRAFERPEGIVEAEYCLDSGLVPTEACRYELRGDRTAIGYFKAGHVPHQSCTAHREAHYDLLTDLYGAGSSDEGGAINFYVLSVPDRRTVPGVEPQDAPYTLEYLINRAEQEKKAAENGEEHFAEGKNGLPTEPEATQTEAKVP